MYQFLFCALQVFIICLFVMPTVEPSGSVPLYFVLMTGTAACGVSLGLMISAWSKTSVMAITFIPLILLPQLMFSGFIKFFKNFEGLEEPFSALMPIRWSFESLSMLQYDAIASKHHSLKQIIGFEGSDYWQPFFIIFGCEN